MNRIRSSAIAIAISCLLAGCGDDKPLKPASGGGGATTSATIKVAPKSDPSR